MRSVLPPPLMVSELGSFAERTIVVRKPQIIADVLERNPYPEDIVDRLRAFEDEIAAGFVASLGEGAPDADFWRRAWEPWRGKTWRELAWYFAESYFYRRLLEAVRYFQPGPWHLVDPFESQKREALAQGLEALARFRAPPPKEHRQEEEFALRLRQSLWGNRADLSNLTVAARVGREAYEERADRLLVDHTQRLWRLLSGGEVRRADLVADNCGLELLSDLALSDFFLSHHLVERVHFHLKGQPFFVSDAMAKDLVAAVTALQKASSSPMRQLGQRLEGERASGRLAIHQHPFWTTSLFLKDLPQDLLGAFSRSHLVIFKGDVNYRRLLEDRHWPPTTSLDAITTYMPTSFLALRTLKAELVVGLPPGLSEELEREDPEWLINGERGVIHFVPRQRPS